MSMSDAVKLRLQAALAGFAGCKTGDEVADVLRKASVRGRRDTTKDNPIANYVKSHFPMEKRDGLAVSVTEERVWVQFWPAHTGAYISAQASVETSQAMREFIVGFDLRDRYTDLRAEE